MISIDLHDKVAVITGGGQGLGQVTGSLLHAAGTRVVVTYLDDPAGVCRQRAEETVAPWQDRGLAIAADVRVSVWPVGPFLPHPTATAGRSVP